MNSQSRRHVSLGDAVGPPNTTSSDLINTDSAADNPLLLFAPERPSFTPGRSPAGRAFEQAPARSSVLDLRPLESASARSPMLDSERQRVRVPSRRLRKRAGMSLFVTTLMLGVLIGFAGGFASGLRNDAPPPVVPPRPAQADEQAALSSASDVGDTTKQAWEQLPVGTQSGASVPVEPDSGTPLNGSAQPAHSARPVPSITPTQGSIEVESRPSDAAVALDGRIVGRTPLSIPDVAEGTHVVGIELPGFSRWATAVQVNRGEQARVGASLSPAP
jgi:PEGA domain